MKVNKIYIYCFATRYLHKGVNPKQLQSSRFGASVTRRTTRQITCSQQSGSGHMESLSTYSTFWGGYVSAGKDSDFWGERPRICGKRKRFNLGFFGFV